MQSTPYRYQRGETITVSLVALAGAEHLANVTGIMAALKPAVAGAFAPPDSVAPVANFTITDRAAAGDVGPGWNLVLNTNVSAGIAVGTYVTNAVITFADGVIEITEPLLIRIEASV